MTYGENISGREYEDGENTFWAFNESDSFSFPYQEFTPIIWENVTLYGDWLYDINYYYFITSSSLYQGMGFNFSCMNAITCRDDGIDEVVMGCTASAPFDHCGGDNRTWGGTSSCRWGNGNALSHMDYVLSPPSYTVNSGTHELLFWGFSDSGTRTITKKSSRRIRIRTNA